MALKHQDVLKTFLQGFRTRIYLSSIKIKMPNMLLLQTVLHVDLGKPLENKASIPSTSCLTVCTIRGSIFACTIGKPTGKLKFGYTVELKLWNSKKKSKVNFPTFDCFSKQKISEKPNRLVSSIEGYKDSPAKIGIASKAWSPYSCNSHRTGLG